MPRRDSECRGQPLRQGLRLRAAVAVRLTDAATPSLCRHPAIRSAQRHARLHQPAGRVQCVAVDGGAEGGACRGRCGDCARVVRAMPRVQNAVSIIGVRSLPRPLSPLRHRSTGDGPHRRRVVQARVARGRRCRGAAVADAGGRLRGGRQAPDACRARVHARAQRGSDVQVRICGCCEKECWRRGACSLPWWASDRFTGAVPCDGKRA